MKNREFTYKNLRFYLNDNHWHREIEGKYVLMVWNSCCERWQEVLHVDTKKEALTYIKENYLYI